MNKPTDSPCRHSQDVDLCVTNCSPGQGRAVPGARRSKSASTRNAVQGLTLSVAAQSTGMSPGTFSSSSSGNTPRVLHVPGHGSTTGTATAGEENKGKPSAHTTALAPAVGTSYTPERELWSGCPYRWSQNAPKARDGFLAACPDLSPSLIISQRDNGAGVPWACVQR